MADIPHLSVHEYSGRVTGQQHRDHCGAGQRRTSLVRTLEVSDQPIGGRHLDGRLLHPIHVYHLHDGSLDIPGLALSGGSVDSSPVCPDLCLHLNRHRHRQVSRCLFPTAINVRVSTLQMRKNFVFVAINSV